MAGVRKKVHLDYKRLGSTGGRVVVERNSNRVEAVTEERMDGENGTDNNAAILQTEEGCKEALSDFFEENKLADAYNLEEIDNNVAELKELRIEYKRVHRQLKVVITEYDRDLKPAYDELCLKISEYIKNAKTEKRTRSEKVEAELVKHKEKEKKEKEDKEEKAKQEKVKQEARICGIKVKEIDEKVKQIKTLCTAVDFLEDDEVLDLKSNLKAIDQELRDLRDMRDKFEVVISEFVNKEAIIKDLSEKYKTISAAAVKYKEDLKKEIKKRELEDYKLNATSKLSIEIPKFTGTDHRIDIYTFKTKFTEEHARLPKNKCLYQLKEKYLGGAAKEMVKLVDDMEEIWKILKDAYGDPKVLLDCELKVVRELGPLSRTKDPQDIALSLSKLGNAMENLSTTAKTHGIEYDLFNSHTEGFIYEILGNERVERYMEKYDEKLGHPENDWQLMIDFVREEAKRKSKIALKLSAQLPKKETDKKSHYSDSLDDVGEEVGGSYQCDGSQLCKACGGTSCENKGDKDFQYVKCKEFRGMKASERLKKLIKDKVCFQCLQGTHFYNDQCTDTEFGCKHDSHKKFRKTKHVLVCQDHEEDEENKRALEKYKLKIFISEGNIPQNFVSITLSSYKVEQVESGTSVEKAEEDDKEETEHAAYMLQRVKIDGEIYNLFYDGGCGDMVCRDKATRKLGSRATEVIPGPTKLIGVGDTMVETKHGLWILKLPMANGRNAIVSGLCLDKITHTLPEYEYDDSVQKDIKDYCVENKIDLNKLPQFPKKAGGETDIMLGMQYKKYFPVELVVLPSGLTLCESKFVGADGTRGVICGPHRSFTAAQKRSGAQYVMNVYNNFFRGTPIVPSVSLLSFGEDEDFPQMDYVSSQVYLGRIAKCMEAHEAAEAAGTVCDYRCNDCRICPNCKKGAQIESVSLEKEYHQGIVDKSVAVDVGKGQSIATLPIVEECPEKVLVPNGQEVKRIFRTVMKQIERDPQSKGEIVAFEGKLQNMGYVEYVGNLSEKEQKQLRESPIQNFLPWFCVYSKNSVTTPCRMVFNASYSSKGNRSLNSILASGINSMNSLLQIVLRWSTHPIAYHSDVQKMYNSVLLDPAYWCYQRYWWQENLDPRNPIVQKVIKTLIFGMKSSGNQAERALRLTASLMEEQYPEASQVVRDDTYVDDMLSGARSTAEAKDIAEDIKQLIRHGGFIDKGFSFSGEDPPQHLSEDGESLKVAGWKWFPKSDQIQLSAGQLSFEKKRRGKIDPNKIGVIPEKFDRKQCHGKVGEIFDLTGKVAPIVAGMKLDLRNLRKLQWEDTIPDALRQCWTSNFELIKELPTLRYQRCVIPEDAVSLEMETLEFGDSSESLACAAIYVRLKRANGMYSCQLILGRTKLLPEGSTVPRGELVAANISATSGFVVRKSLGSYCEGYIKFTDSQVALFWINSLDKPLKQFVRGLVIEIRRLSDADRWFYIQSKNNVADIGTRKGAQIKDVSSDSNWINGLPWMTTDEDQFPTMTVDDINFSNIRDDFNAEMLKYAKVIEGIEALVTEVDTSVFASQIVTKEDSSSLRDRYKFNNYLVDPNKFRLRKVVRIVAMVQRYIRNLRLAVQRKKDATSTLPILNDENRAVPFGLNDAEDGD